MALLDGIEVDRHGAHARDGQLGHQDALVDVLLKAHVDGVKLLGRLNKRLLGAGGQVLVSLGGIQKLLAQLGPALRETLRTLLTHGREGAHELHREVVSNGVEETRVVCPQRARTRPAHLDDGYHVAAKPHGHGKEAREGRQQALADAQDLAGLLVHDLAHANLALAQLLRLRGLHAQSQGVAGTRGEGLD